MTRRESPPPILLYGDVSLRHPTRDLAVGTPETRRVLDRLWSTLTEGTGVGLAAPQIGEAVRAFVVRDPDREGEAGRLDFVNPVLMSTYGEEEVFEEGCLSFPGLYFDVVRRRGAVIEYHDAEGNPRKLRNDGLISRIAQHEIDHLDGTLFIDRIGPLHRLWLRPRLLWIALQGAVRRGMTGRKHGA